LKQVTSDFKTDTAEPSESNKNVCQRREFVTFIINYTFVVPPPPPFPDPRVKRFAYGRNQNKYTGLKMKATSAGSEVAWVVFFRKL
jgi:hypothetical protein